MPYYSILPALLPTWEMCPVVERLNLISLTQSLGSFVIRTDQRLAVRTLRGAPLSIRGMDIQLLSFWGKKQSPRTG
jgi:hypothetical protein